jgi:hypothetical protein
MSNPTGNIYLQIYNSEFNRYVEIPPSTAKFGFVTTPKDSFSFSETPDFSGFYFSRPVKISGSIETLPINIGANNVNQTGSIFGANIGVYNSNLTTNLEYANGGYIGNYNLGYINNFIDSINSYNVGYYNSSVQNQNSLILGGTNLASGQTESINIGHQNISNTVDNIYLLGIGNTTNSGVNLILLGIGNQNSDVQNGNIIGTSNINSISNGINIFGNSNNISGLNNNIIVGNLNSAINSTDNIIVGNLNAQSYSSNNSIFGIGNQILTGDSNNLFGNSNNTSGIGNTVFGKSNLINGTQNSIYGNVNSLSKENFLLNIYGTNNILSGTNNSTLFGNNNTLDQSIINQLYRVELTGITGLGVGQTRFTGVTGYRMLGGYSGIPGSGGTFNFFVGNDNQTSLNNFSYIFGDSNQVLNNSTAYIFGSNNYLEKSTNSYAFGENNSVSGFKNYAFGNNNVIRSGEYNSILIGISHTFTGNFKVASVNIASVDSSIEVNPSEIHLKSPTRPKINGEEIVIESQLDAAINSISYTGTIQKNGLTFTNNIFQDPNYDKLADKIFLPTFTYNSGASIGAVASAQSFTSDPLLFLPSFSIYSTTSYKGKDFNILYATHSNPSALKALSSPAWIVVDNYTSGIYYRNDITTYDKTPQTGWYPTGFKANNIMFTGTTSPISVSLVMGTRTGFMSINDPIIGTAYIPIYY